MIEFKTVDHDESRIDNYEGECPQCSGKTTFYHDMRCTKCNQTTITWCPKCERHVELLLE